MNKMKKFLSIVSIIGLCLYPIDFAYGRLKEKVITWDSTSGHVHDGSTKGKKVDSSNVVNTPAGDIVATDVQSAINELDTEKISTSEKGAASGVATLDGSSKVLAVQLPAIAITDVNVCASQVCQLALTAEEGDVCIRSDEDKSYIHNGGIVGDMTDWSVLLSTGLVTSVNGETGDVINVERTTRLQTTISDSDVNYPSSGAVVDYVTTHADNNSAHHNYLSNGYDITPATVTTTGDITINSDATDDQLLFGTAGDANIFRYAANQLRTNDAFGVDRTFGLSAFFTLRTGDGGWRWYNDVDGKQVWGPGDGSYDTYLYRSAVSELNTDGGFNAAWFLATRSSAGSHAIAARVTGDSYYRLFIQADGTVEWGSGAATRDTNLYRSAADTLRTDDALKISDKVHLDTAGYVSTTGPSASSWGFMTRIDGDSTWRLGIESDGDMKWGAGGGSYDTVLSRSAANTLALGAGDSLTADTAANYKHGTTTKYLTVAGSGGFVPTTTDGVAVGTNSISPSAVGGTKYGAGAVHLPVGVVVTRLDVYGLTNDSGDTCTIYLDSRDSAGASTALANCTFADGTDSCNDTSISNATIDASRGYHLIADMYADDVIGNTQLFYVKITYTNSNASQTQ